MRTAHEQRAINPVPYSTKSLPVRRSCISKGKKNRNNPFFVQPTVTFNVVSIREFEQTLVVNPSTSSGLGIGLGWSFEDKETVHINNFEHGCNQQGKNSFQKRHLDFRLSKNEREDIIRSKIGCSESTIVSAMVETRMRQERRRKNSKLNRMEKTSSALKRLSFNIKGRITPTKTTVTSKTVTPKNTSYDNIQETSKRVELLILSNQDDSARQFA